MCLFFFFFFFNLGEPLFPMLIRTLQEREKGNEREGEREREGREKERGDRREGEERKREERKKEKTDMVDKQRERLNKRNVAKTGRTKHL